MIMHNNDGMHSYYAIKQVKTASLGILEIKQIINKNV